MQVPLLDLTAQFASIRDEIIPVVQRVIDSQQFILGPEVEAFEQEMAAYCGSADAVGVTSGTDAILVGLMALDIGPGDAVLTSPFSFFATAGSISRVGARPVFADIDPVTYNLDPEAVARFLADECEPGPRPRHRATGARVRAIMPVHLFGQVAEMDPLLRIAVERDLAVIEDAAQAIGAADGAATAAPRRAGAIGDLGAFSFFPSKNLGAFGDGGMVTVADPDLAVRLRRLRMHGAVTRYQHEEIGGNFRLDALQAAVLRVKLRHLDEWSDGRARNAAFYAEALESIDEVVPPTVAPGRRHIFNQYVIRARRRDELVRHLADRGVGCAIYYPIPLHRQPCYADLEYPDGAFPQSERAAREVLAIPVYSELADDQREAVVAAIREFYAGGGAG